MILVMLHPISSMVVMILVLVSLALAGWAFFTEPAEQDIPLYSICNGLDPGSFLWYFYGCFLLTSFKRLASRLWK